MSIPRHGPTRYIKLALAGGILAAGAIASVVGLNMALQREAGVVILWLGWLSLGLIVGSALCVFFATTDFLQTRKRLPATGAVHKLPKHYEGDYLAKYSIGDRAVALGLAIASATLATFFVSGSASWIATAISIVLVLGAAFYLSHVGLTRVLFTANGLVVRRPFQREFSETYANVKRISGKPGTVKLEFADGRSLKLHSGLGNPDVVIGYLQTHCPESLDLG